MFMHPTTHLWLVEQDRERAMAQRALERAARSGGEHRPGFERGGMTSFARYLRRVVAAAVNYRPGGGAETPLAGSSGA